MTAPAPNRCAACGRRLQHPSPTGLGPVCQRRLNGPPAARNTTRAPHAPSIHHIPGQTEIQLSEHQPTLWSL